MNFNQNSLLSITNRCINIVRNASKKTGGSTRNPVDPHNRPKHRGPKRQDGHWVTEGTVLALQTKPRFFPGLNVGVGRNMTLTAKCHGQVFVTCEKTDLNYNVGLVKKFFADREGHNIYKKYYNVLPMPQHNRFVLKSEN